MPDKAAAYAELFEKVDKTFENWPEKLWRVFYCFDILSEEERARLAAIVAANPELIEEIRAASERGGPLALIDLSGGLRELHKGQPHLETLGLCLALLAMDAELKAHDGDRAEAIEDLLAGMRLADAVSAEPSPDALRMSQQGYRHMSKSYQRAFAAGDVPRDVAEELIRHLDQARHREALRDTVEVQQYLVLDMVEDLDRLGPYDFLSRYAEGDKDKVVMNISLWLLGSPLGRPLVNVNVANYNQMMEQSIATALQSPHFGMQAQRQRLGSSGPIGRVYVRTTNALTYHSEPTVWMQVGHEATLDLMRVGIAVETYQAEHGAPPASLEAVAPMLGGTVPLDPWSGEAFHYQTDGSTFVLYSVGGNGVDDGGRYNPDGGPHNDMVWRAIARP